MFGRNKNGGKTEETPTPLPPIEMPPMPSPEDAPGHQPLTPVSEQDMAALRTELETRLSELHDDVDELHDNNQLHNLLGEAGVSYNAGRAVEEIVAGNLYTAISILNNEVRRIRRVRRAAQKK